MAQKEVLHRYSPKSTLPREESRQSSKLLPVPTSQCAPCWPLLPPAGCHPRAQVGRKVRDKVALRSHFISSQSLSPTDHPPPSLATSQGAPRACRWCRSLPCDLVGTVQQSSVNVLGTGNLGFDERQVLRVGLTVRLHCIWFGGCGHQQGRVLGTVATL